MGDTTNVLDRLEQLPVSEVKKRGWKAVMRLVSDKGAVVVTNHDQPEAVIVPTAEYARLREVARERAGRLDTAEDALRQEWQQRLAVLTQPATRTAVDTLLQGPITLGGTAKAGEGW